jgi:ATP adenylyltransferase
MDTLWAPWRLNYVTVAKEPSDACFLCRFLAQPEQDGENLVLMRTEWSCVVLNRFPYNNGHLLVAPLAHKAGLDELTSEELLDGMEVVRAMVRHLGGALSPDGYNVGLNLGRAAGAGLPGHLHWHIVPRWSGDTNFMTTCADERVIVQSLTSLYDMLRERMRPSGG